MYYSTGNRNKTLFSCILKIVVLLVGVVGEYLFWAMGREDNMCRFTYYIHLTNILAVVVVFLLLCLNIRDLKRIVNNEVVPAKSRFLAIVHYFVVTTVASPLWLSIFALFIENGMRPNAVNIISHFLFQIIILVDWFIFGRVYAKNAGLSIYAIFVPVVYGLYIFVSEIFEVGIINSSGLFFGYEINGWFNIGDDGIGLFYYLMIVTAVMIVSNFLILKINIVCHKNERQNSNLI